jgi:hypothetical protein
VSPLRGGAPPPDGGVGGVGRGQGVGAGGGVGRAAGAGGVGRGGAGDGVAGRGGGGVGRGAAGVATGRGGTGAGATRGGAAGAAFFGATFRAAALARRTIFLPAFLAPLLAFFAAAFTLRLTLANLLLARGFAFDRAFAFAVLRPAFFFFAGFRDAFFFLAAALAMKHLRG